MPRLRRSDCSKPGIRRLRRGRGFEYRREDDGPVHDPDDLARIRSLVIPPAWTDVWICEDARGHLQATGLDAAGRRQYLYHPEWRRRRDREKFEHMLDFAAALPRMRRLTEERLGDPGLGRDRVLSCAVRLLDRGFFRIGSESYAEANNTYGLATMLRSHVSVKGDRMVQFDYPAKGGIQRVQSVVDEAVFDVVAALKHRKSKGRELLAYRDGRRWVDVHSSDINEYIRELAGGDFSAKDFRTWNATVLAATSLAVLGRSATSATARKRVVSLAIGEVARYLGNTPAVCRASYIDPAVIDRFNGGQTIAEALDRIPLELPQPERQRRIEQAVRRLLDGGRRNRRAAAGSNGRPGRRPPAVARSRPAIAGRAR
jgi:DNA topoisomerase-1